MAPEATSDQEEPEWVDLEVKIVFDDLYLKQHQGILDEVQLDPLVWTAIISGGMTKLYGLVGSSLYYTLEKLESQGLKAIIRVMKEDEKVFLNSFFTHKFKLSSYYGGSVDCECYVGHIKSSKV